MGSWLDETLTWGNALMFILWGVILLAIVLGFVTYAIFFERKVIGWMQFRIGPNRVGPFGLLQTIADITKLLIKEDTIPRKADRALFILAPALAYVPCFCGTGGNPVHAELVFCRYQCWPALLCGLVRHLDDCNRPGGLGFE